MRDNVRMVLTLLIIGAICGGLLSMVNGVTAPVIEARAKAQFLEALQGFFPAVADSKVTDIGGEEFYTCYDGSGNLMGVVASVTAKGYGGPISYDLAVDKGGAIIGIRIKSHTETPGIGDVIEKDKFQGKVIGLNFADPISAGVDVDTISGATVTTSGVISSIRRVMNIVGEQFLGMEVEKTEVDLTTVADGTYTGTGRGFKSDITVEVTVSGGKITNIVVLEQDDTPNFFNMAEGQMIERIINAQNLEVDMVSGATGSSTGIIKAVFDALK
ncbi:MAG: FMN-binding protein [Bacillota bacterium]